MGAVALLVILMFIMGCFFIKDDKVKTSEKNDYGKTLEKNDYGKTLEKNDYGVFLNADASSLERFKKYDLIVIDAQYFTKKDIESSGNIIKLTRSLQLASTSIGMKKNGWMCLSRHGRSL